MPKQWILTWLYIVFIACVLVGIMHYDKQHPITDEEQKNTGKPL